MFGEPTTYSAVSMAPLLSCSPPSVRFSHVCYLVIGNRLVGGGTGAARKLRGTAARERQEQARIIVKDRYVEEAVRR